MKKNSILAGVVVASLLASSAFAETAPLPAGKPAGSKDAALLALGVLPLTLIAGFATLVIVAGAGGFSSESKPATSSVTTTGTGA